MSPPPRTPDQTDRTRTAQRIAGACFAFAALPLVLIGVTGRPWLIAFAVVCVLVGVAVLVVRAARNANAS
jgi:hypothetical protein